MAPSDTSPRAHEVSVRRLAEMTPAERVRLGVNLWQTAYALQRSAVRRLHPEADEAEIAFQIALSRFGPELARKVYKRT